MFDADYTPPLRAGIPAAVRAALDTATPRRCAPGRDAAATVLGCPARATFSAARYADGLRGDAAAVGPRGTPIDERAAQARRRIAALRAGRLRPVRHAESCARTRSTSACAGRTSRAAPARRPAPYPAVPTLILQGGEDLRTPPEGSARVAAHAPGAQRVVVPGVGHAVTGRRPDGCGVRAAAGVPARRGGVGALQARADARARDGGAAARRSADVAPVAGVPGRRGADGQRRST